MKIKIKEIVYPLPNEGLIKKNEKSWRQKLPDDYKGFLMKFNGGKPEKISFLCNNHSYAVMRFLSVFESEQESDIGWYDINVVATQIDERLTSNGDLLGYDVLPIAELFAGDYLCLDFRADKDNPSVCVWSHEESGVFDPVTYQTADSFSEFLELLH